MISGERDFVSMKLWMKIHEQWECLTLCAIKMKARNGGGGGAKQVTTAGPEEDR